MVARSRATKQTWVYPGNGAGGLGPRVGPFTGFSGVRPAALPGQVPAPRPATSSVGTPADGLLVFAGSGRDRGRPWSRWAGPSRTPNLLLNVGDWNGDGKGDVMSRVHRPA